MFLLVVQHRNPESGLFQCQLRKRSRFNQTTASNRSTVGRCRFRSSRYCLLKRVLMRLESEETRSVVTADRNEG